MTQKQCLVYETLGKISDMEIIRESADGLMRLHGVFGVCGVKNNNNRIYNKKNYGMMVETLQKEITQGSVLGELEHPNTMNITLENVSHKIESIQMNEDGTITGTIVLLNTPKGKIAQAIAEASGSLFISSRGAGSIDESGNVTLSTIKTYDLVGTPGFSQAKLNLAKGQKFESLNESLEDGNIMYAIINESDDLLDDKKSDEKEDKKSDEKDEKDDKKSDEKEDNKNSDKDTTMNELKEAIEKLTEKVTSLEAELHVAQESLTSKDHEIAALNEAIANIETVNYDAIETWVNEEFATEFKNEIMQDVNENIDNLTETFAEGVQNWVCEEFAPEVQNWVCEEFAPEVQNWVCEEFAPEIENWITEEYSPEVQNWICEEFAPVVEGWINEEFAPEHANNIESKVNENVSAFIESQKDNKLSEIDALLESLDSKKDEALEILKEQKTADKYAGVYIVENMPAQFQPSWNMLSENKKSEILRSSKMYDFTKEGVLESFWANVDLTEEVKPVINENANIVNNYHNNIAQAMMRLRINS